MPPGSEEPAGGGVSKPEGSVPEVTPEQVDERVVHDPYNYIDDPYVHDQPETDTQTLTVVPSVAPPAPPSPPKPKDPEPEEEDDDEGMLRMSFLDHLEELRSRIISALMGLGVAFILALVFANELWGLVVAPAMEALTRIGVKPELVIISPMEGFSIIWVKVPLVAAIFVASPWVLYQVWSFIAPGLYKRERQYAAPFVISTAGLFITGGLFAYFVAFRFGLAFLLGIGHGQGVSPMVSVNEYFDLFVNVMLGVGLVFELPILVFFLVLLRIVTPSFLIANSRYAILCIVIIAAVVTPTPDVFNLALFALPMIVLYFIGVFAGYLLVLKRENRRFPWGIVLFIFILFLALLVAASWIAVVKYGYRLVPVWPFLVR
ncbi:MAG: twin-arginine translocase subunit TatC [Bryobacteraceae bacterium]